jgi:putative transport protein
MDMIRTVLETQPLFSLFLTVALGFLVGEINIKGFSLGSGAVIFVGLAIGGFAPKAAPPSLLGTMGLLLFLYGVGVLYGGQFFRGLTSAEGLKANLAAAIGVVIAGGLSLALVPLAGIHVGETLGLFAGSGTSSATLQAAISALKTDGPAIGYSVAYPLGVAVPILCIYLLNVWLKPKIEQPLAQQIETAEIALRNTAFIGMLFSELTAKLPVGVAIAAVRRQEHNQVPSESFVLNQDDILLATSTDKAQLQQAVSLLGELKPGSIATDRQDLDYIRVFVSKRTVVGRTIGDLDLPTDVACSIVQVRRGDSDMLPRPDLILEVGDRIGVFVHRSRIKAVRSYFGDSIKGTADFSYISMGIGAALGLLVGMIPLPIPGVGKLTLGLAGLLLFALYLGKIRRTGPVVWTMPLSANLVLRNFGLTIFLAQVGMASGPKFFATIGATGPVILLYSVVITLAMALITTFICLKIFRLPFDTAMGVMSGATGNPAILAFASRTTPTDRPDVGYAMIFPSMTVLKILFVQIAAAILGR